MTITSLLLQQNGATLNPPTGGQDTALNVVGKEIPNGLYLSETLNPNYKTRRSVTLKTRMSALQSDGSYSKEKRSIVIVEPITLADGTIAYNLIRMEVEFHPESTSTMIGNLRSMGADFICDSNQDDFIVNGDLT